MQQYSKFPKVSQSERHFPLFDQKSPRPGVVQKAFHRLADKLFEISKEEDFICAESERAEVFYE